MDAGGYDEHKIIKHLVIDEARVVNGEFTRSHGNGVRKNKSGYGQLQIVINLLGFQGLQHDKSRLWRAAEGLSVSYMC